MSERTAGPPPTPRAGPAREAEGDPAMIIIGDDALALGVAAELLALQRHRVSVLWHPDAEFARAVERVGVKFIPGRPDSAEALDRAGVAEAVTILALSRDDHLNLYAALRARDANPRIRIVLRQLNRTLAGKIEQNLTNCSVLSPTLHSAATYAAAAVDPACFLGLLFPDAEGSLAGFVRRDADRVAGMTVADAERELAARILAVDGDTGIARDAVLAAAAELVLFGEIDALHNSIPRSLPHPSRPPLRRRLHALLRRTRQRVRRVDPILSRLTLAALAVLVGSTVYFRLAFGSGWLDALYFVVSTMATAGYLDVVPQHLSTAEIVVTILLMLAGLGFTGVFIALVASALTRIQWVAMEGLRPVRRRGHIVVCGAGNVGSGVIDLLLALDQRLVVVEIAPEPGIVEQARERRFDLLTGDASRDRTLDLCNLGAAHSLLALTNVDTLNLEIALGARARNPDLPIVLRIAEAGFAGSIARHFQFDTTFSAATLATPAFVGLSHLPGARGRVGFADQEFGIREIVIGEDAAHMAMTANIPLAIARNDAFRLAHSLDRVAPGDRVLMLHPLAALQESGATLAAAAERLAPAERPL